MSSVTTSNTNGPVITADHSFPRLKRPSRCLPLDLSSAKSYRLSTLISCSPEFPDAKTFIPPRKRMCMSDSSLKMFPSITPKSFIPAYQFASLLQKTSIISKHSGTKLPSFHCNDSQQDIPILLVLDTRPNAMFLSHHITGAFHCKEDEHVTVKPGDILIHPSFIDSIYTILQEKYPFLKPDISHSPQKLSSILQGYHVYIVLIYQKSWDDNLESSIPKPNLAKFTPLSHLISTICSSFSISILQGGFKHFSLLYPNLCENNDSVRIPNNVSEPIGVDEKVLFPLTCPPFEALDTVEEDLSNEETYWFNYTASQILSFLFLGNEIDSQNRQFLRSEDIGFVLNVSSNLPLVEEPGIHCHRIPLVDSSSQELKLYWKEAYNFIEKARKSGHCVLVHCQAGVSRSATIVIAYLMLRNGWRLNDAYDFVRMRRKCIAPNLGFFGQLMRLENSDLHATIMADGEKNGGEMDDLSSSSSENDIATYQEALPSSFEVTSFIVGSKASGTSCSSDQVSVTRKLSL